PASAASARGPRRSTAWSSPARSSAERSIPRVPRAPQEFSGPRRDVLNLESRMIPGGLRRALRESSTITWRTVAVACAIALTVLAAWIILLHREARRHAAQEAERSADVVAQAVAREQARLIEASQQLLFGLSQRPEVVGARAGECAAFFDGVVRAYGGDLDLAHARAAGPLVASAPRTDPPPGPARRHAGRLAARA